MAAGAFLVEACVDSLESAQAAKRAGADRVELCGSLAEGGITPSAGLIEACVEHAGLPVHVMIRPRGGDFVYSGAELDIMRRDIASARILGARGVVAGLLTADGRIDVELTRALVDHARPLPFTFHRAFDATRDLDQALEDLLETGADRVLTSGGAATAFDGIPELAGLVDAATGRIAVMAGGRIRERNVRRIAEETRVREVHARCAAARRDDFARLVQALR
jgi:copper homeostasis protein